MLSYLKLDVPLVLSYDIICQWLINRDKRWSADSFPSHLRIDLPTNSVRYVIPKYHFNGHREDDHNRFSLNFMKGVGRTDGEEVERGWAKFNGIAGSTREMGPGSREETLEDHFEFNNVEKYLTLGS